MIKKLLFFVTSLLILSGCVKDDIIDDFVNPVVRIMNPIDTIGFNSTYQFSANFFNNVGQEETKSLAWKSSDESIIVIDQNGLATSLQTGESTIRVEATDDSGSLVFDEVTVSVGENTVVASPERSGTLMTTTFYELQGDFIMKEESGELVLEFSSNYKASSSLPGLYVYLTNNPNTTAGALEVGKVTDFQGAHSYVIDGGVGINDYEYLLYFCKPFNVKVGDGQFDN